MGSGLEATMNSLLEQKAGMPHNVGLAAGMVAKCRPKESCRTVRQANQQAASDGLKRDSFQQKARVAREHVQRKPRRSGAFKVLGQAYEVFLQGNLAICTKSQSVSLSPQIQSA